MCNQTGSATGSTVRIYGEGVENVESGKAVTSPLYHLFLFLTIKSGRESLATHEVFLCHRGREEGSLVGE